MLPMRAKVHCFHLLALIVALPTAAAALAREGGSEKAPVPDAAAQEKALGLVAEIYEKSWKEARTSAEKTALAEKMIDAAAKAEGDAAGRFVLLRAARDIATEAGDAAAALRAIDRLDAAFQIDAAEMKTAALLEASRSAVTQDHHETIATEALALVEAAVEKNNFEDAERLLRVGQAAARKLRDGESVRAYVQLSREVERIARAYQRIKPALKTLDEKPTDPEANLAVGRFLCFEKGDWRRGIPMLVLGSDKDLAALAEKELRGLETAEEQVAVADAWWDLADRCDEPQKTKMLLHAGSWYERAILGLGPGLLKTKVQKRLETTRSLERPRAVYVPLPKLLQWFALPPSDWRLESDCLAGTFGRFEDDSPVYATTVFRTRSFRCGLKIKAKWYHSIYVEVDGRSYGYSVGHWRNTGTWILDGTEKGVSLRPGPTVKNPEEWVALDAALAKDILTLYYGGRPVWRHRIPPTETGVHVIRFGFNCHETVVRIKDVYFRED